MTLIKIDQLIYKLFKIGIILSSKKKLLCEQLIWQWKWLPKYDLLQRTYKQWENIQIHHDTACDYLFSLKMLMFNVIQALHTCILTSKGRRSEKYFFLSKVQQTKLPNFLELIKYKYLVINWCGKHSTIRNI